MKKQLYPICRLYLDSTPTRYIKSKGKHSILLFTLYDPLSSDDKSLEIVNYGLNRVTQYLAKESERADLSKLKAVVSDTGLYIFSKRVTIIVEDLRFVESEIEEKKF